MNALIYSFYAFLATLNFAIIFNIRGKNVFFAALGGGLGWYIYLVCLDFKFADVSSFFISSIIVSIYSEVLARVFKTPVTTFIICAILPLVPGAGMYYTMLETIHGNINKSLSTGLNTIIVAGTIAIGVVLVSSIIRLITYKPKHK